MDYSNAFVQADIDEEVYCDLLLELFGPSSESYILKLKKSLYGLNQAPCLWFKMLGGANTILDSRQVKMMLACL